MNPDAAPFRCMDCHVEPEGSRWAIYRSRADGSRIRIGGADTLIQAEGVAYVQAGADQTDCHIT